MESKSLAHLCSKVSTMILGFQHKGLKHFYETGDKRGIQPSHAKRLWMILSLLDAAQSPGELAIPALRLHPLQGSLQDHWAVSVSGNWRVIFRFTGANITSVDYLDYH